VSRSSYYDAAVRTADECIHQVQGGDIVRPWCDTPACPLCRRRHPVHWRRLGQDAKPRPSNVVQLNRSRKLW
jgi:hypothetical protein